MRTTATLLFAIVCAAGSARADELAPIENLSIKLTTVVGSAYYTVEKDGYQVVTTLAGSEDATPVRFVATLLSGQKVIVSVPRALGESTLEIEIKRIEDRVFVNDNTQISRLGQ